MNYRIIEDLSAVMFQKLSICHCDCNAKACIFNPFVFCIESEYNQAVEITSLFFLWCVRNIESIFESEYCKDTSKRDKHFLFPNRYVLKFRIKIAYLIKLNTRSKKQTVVQLL